VPTQVKLLERSVVERPSDGPNPIPNVTTLEIIKPLQDSYANATLDPNNGATVSAFDNAAKRLKYTDFKDALVQSSGGMTPEEASQLTQQVQIELATLRANELQRKD